jgi:hypothetical protein
MQDKALHHANFLFLYMLQFSTPQLLNNIQLFSNPHIIHHSFRILISLNQASLP